MSKFTNELTSPSDNDTTFNSTTIKDDRPSSPLEYDDTSDDNSSVDEIIKTPKKSTVKVPLNAPLKKSTWTGWKKPSTVSPNMKDLLDSSVVANLEKEFDKVVTVKDNSKYKTAINEARALLFQQCLPNDKMKNIIKNNINKADWRPVSLTVNFDDDSFNHVVDGETFTFSKKRFLENKHFRNDLIKHYTAIDPKCWLNMFFPKGKNLFVLRVDAKKQ